MRPVMFYTILTIAIIRAIEGAPTINAVGIRLSHPNVATPIRSTEGAGRSFVTTERTSCDDGFGSNAHCAACAASRRSLARRARLCSGN